MLLSPVRFLPAGPMMRSWRTERNFIQRIWEGGGGATSSCICMLGQPPRTFHHYVKRGGGGREGRREEGLVDISVSRMTNACRRCEGPSLPPSLVPGNDQETSRHPPTSHTASTNACRTTHRRSDCTRRPSPQGCHSRGKAEKGREGRKEGV